MGAIASKCIKAFRDCCRDVFVSQSIRRLYTHQSAENPVMGGVSWLHWLGQLRSKATPDLIIGEITEKPCSAPAGPRDCNLAFLL
jgi:hypothetical protein